MADDARTMIAEISRAVSDDTATLTDWEEEFLSNVSSLVEAGFSLSDKQDAVLERIWKKCTQ